MAGIANPGSSDGSQTHSGDYHRARHRSDDIGTNVLQTLELSGKRHSRLVNSAQPGCQPRLCQGAGHQLRTLETARSDPRAHPPSGTGVTNQSSTLDRPAREGEVSPRANAHLSREMHRACLTGRCLRSNWSNRAARLFPAQSTATGNRLASAKAASQAGKEYGTEPRHLEHM